MEQKCPTCHGTNRVHKESSLFPNCSGSDCFWCSECTDSFHKKAAQSGNAPHGFIDMSFSSPAQANSTASAKIDSKTSEESVKMVPTVEDARSELARKISSPVIQNFVAEPSSYSGFPVTLDQTAVDIDSVLSGFENTEFNLEDHFLSLDLQPEGAEIGGDTATAVRQSRSSWTHLIKGQSSRIKLIRNRYEATDSVETNSPRTRRQEIKSILTLQDSALTKKNVQQFENGMMKNKQMSNRDGHDGSAEKRSVSPLAKHEYSRETQSASLGKLIESNASAEPNDGSTGSNGLVNPRGERVPSLSIEIDSSALSASGQKFGSGNLALSTSSSHNLPHFYLKRLTGNQPLSASLSNIPSPASALSGSSGQLNALRDSSGRIRSSTAASPGAELGSSSRFDESYMSGNLVSLSQSLMGSSLGLSLAGKKDFKLWYNDFLHECNASAANSREHAGFGSTIQVSDIFGNKLSNNDCDAQRAMMASASEYIALKQEPSFVNQAPNRNSQDEVPSVTPSVVSNRVLEHFQDARISGVDYSPVDEDSKEEIPASGELHQLLDSLIFPTGQSDVYSEIFLATYRFFTSAATLLDALRAWFNVELPQNATKAQKDFYTNIKRPIQARVTRVLLLWIKNHWHNFHTSKELLSDLQSFVKSMEETAFSDASKILAAIRESRLQWYSTQYLSLSGQSVKPAVLKKLAPSAKLSEPLILALSEEQFATQVTLIEHFHFAQLRADTYLHLMTSPASKEGAGTNVVIKVLLEYALWHKTLAAYVCSVILQQENPKKQAKTIKNFLRVANFCYDQCKNYATLFTIVYALKRPVVAQLGQAWELVPNKYLFTFSKYDAICNFGNGYDAYWTDLRSKSLPIIPFFGAHIHDILIIDKQIPNFVDSPGDGSAIFNSTSSVEKRINFAKFTDLDSLICELELYRTCSYKDTINDSNEFMATVFAHIESWPTVDIDI